MLKTYLLFLAGFIIAAALTVFAIFIIASLVLALRGMWIAFVEDWHKEGGDAK